MDECIEKEYMQLKDAILEEELDVVKQTLSNQEFYEKFMDYELYSKYHVTLLNTAVDKKNMAIIELLLSLKLTPNIVDVKKHEHSRTLSLCDSDDVKWAKNIQRIDPYSSSSSVSKTSPLHQAVKIQDIEMIKLLLDHGADPKALDDLSHDTYYYATKDIKCMSILKILLEQSAEVGNPRVLFEAIDHCQTPIVELFLKYIDVNNFRNSVGEGPMHYAIKAKVRSINIMHLLLEAGANIDQADIFGETPLHFATKCEDIDMVKFLLDHGANINVKTIKTPLYLAVSRQNYPIIRLLLDKKPSIDIETKHIQMELLKICRNIDEGLVCDLLRLGLDVDMEFYPDESKKVLIKAIVKLDRQGDSIGKEHLKILRDSQTSSCIRYLNQIDKMRDHLILNNVTLFDVYVASQKKFITLLRNKNFCYALFLHKYNKFPDYKDELNLKISRTLQKIDELDRHENELTAIFGTIFPSEIISRLAEYLI